MTRIVALLLVIVAGWPVAARAERAKPRKVAVLRLRALGVPDEVARALDESLPRRIEETRCCQVLSFVELERVLQFQALKQQVTCEEDSCAAELAGALGVDVVVMGSVSRVGPKYTLSLSAVDARSAHAVARSAETFEGDESELLESVSRAGRLIGTALLPEAPAWPAIVAASGAVVLLGAAGAGLAWNAYVSRPDFRQTELEAANALGLTTNVLLGVGLGLVLTGGIGWLVTQLEPPPGP